MEINIMSKVGQEMFEAQEFATENYNIPRDEFVTLAKNAFANPYRPFAQDAAIQAFDEIQNDLEEYNRYMATGETNASV